MKKKTDPTLDRIREARKRISAQYGHDIEKLVKDYEKLENELERGKENNPAFRPRNLVFNKTFQ